MKNNDFITILFNGHRRVFFILFALTLLAQIYIFSRQNANYALNTIQKDFKIVLSYNAPQEKQESLQNVLKHLSGVNNFKELSSQDIFDIFSKGIKGKSDYVLNPDFVPALYEVEVSEQVLLNPETWMRNTLYSFDENLEIYYKIQQTHLAFYLNAFIKYIDILAILVVLALVSFGFFVEAYYIKISTAKERFCGILCGLIASALALLTSHFLMAYLNLNLSCDNLFSKEQFIIIFLVMILGGTLSKWKRF